MARLLEVVQNWHQVVNTGEAKINTHIINTYVVSIVRGDVSVDDMGIYPGSPTCQADYTDRPNFFLYEYDIELLD